MSEWAPLVYGRTAHKDYRLLATPSWLGADDQAKVVNRLLGMVLQPEELRKGPRWALLRSPSYTVVGVAAMAAELAREAGSAEFAARTAEPSERGQVGRDLYAICAYVARSADQLRVPTYEQLGVRTFAPLYEYVVTYWDTPSYDLEAAELTESRVVTWPPAPAVVTAPLPLGATAATGVMKLWPDVADTRARLWNETKDFASASLYLGLNGPGEARRAKTQNATVVGLSEPIVEQAPADSPPRVEQRQEQAPVYPRPTAPFDERDRGEPAILVQLRELDRFGLAGAGVLAVGGVLVANSIGSAVVLAAVGAGAGYMVGSLVGKSLRDSAPHEPPSSQQTSASTPPPAGAPPVEPSEPTYGLRPKSEDAPSLRPRQDWFPTPDQRD